MEEKDLKEKLPDEPTFEERKKAELEKIPFGLRDMFNLVKDLEDYHKDDMP